MQEIRNNFDLLIELSKRGIDNLIQTYNDSNDYALINILQLYRAIMENPDEFRHIRDGKSCTYLPSTSGGGGVGRPSNVVDVVPPDPTTDQSLRDMDKIFVTIQKLYTSHVYYVIYNVLCILQKSQSVDDTTKIIKGLSTMMEVKHQQIHTWISENIIF